MVVFSAFIIHLQKKHYITIEPITIPFIRLYVHYNVTLILSNKSIIAYVHIKLHWFACSFSRIIFYIIDRIQQVAASFSCGAHKNFIGHCLSSFTNNNLLHQIDTNMV